MFKSIILSISLIALLSSCSHTETKSESKTEDLKPITLRDAAINSKRSGEEIARNSSRNPEKTLSFFGIKPDMTVVEVSPSGGWYTSILGPYLKAKGSLYLAAYPENAEKEYRRKATKGLKKRIADAPSKYGKVMFTEFDSPKVLGPIAPEKDSVDMVVTFRNLHGLVKDKTADKAFKEFFRVLKPGGVLGIVQHRADEGMKASTLDLAKTGYVKQSYVVSLAEKAGFKYDSKSEVNANLKDTKNYKDGVWTLPPVYRLKDKNKAKYTKIGESDRMTLKFIKPSK